MTHQYFPRPLLPEPIRLLPAPTVLLPPEKGLFPDPIHLLPAPHDLLPIPPTPTLGTADISPDGLYRYTLTRRWGQGPSTILWIMLNPSTATHLADDPTIRRCLAFSKAWGFDALVVANLFALRTPDPRQLLLHPDPIGPDNDQAISSQAAVVDLVIAAWGAHPQARSRAKQVISFLPQQIYCLGSNQDGSPRHPLYVPQSQPLVPLS